MSIVVTPIPRLIDLTAPDFTLGLANDAGSALTAVASNSTLLAFDTTLPAAVGTGATGSATVTARRDHVHTGTTQATQAALEAETDQDTFAPPDRIKYSPGVAKAWCLINQDGSIGGSTSYPNSYNIASITDSGAGDRVIVFDIDFSSVVYAGAGSLADDSGLIRILMFANLAVDSIDLDIKKYTDFVGGFDRTDMPTIQAFYGDQ